MIDQTMQAWGSFLGWLSGQFAGATPVNRDIAIYILAAVAGTALISRWRFRKSHTATGTALAVQPRAHRVGEVVSAFESETAAVFERTAPAREHIVLYVLVLMLLASFGASAMVKLDRVVTGTGRIITVGGELYVSPLDRSIVRELLVKEGDLVKKGQVLATLDATFASADLGQLTQKQVSLSAEVARRQAEMAGRPYTPPAGDQYGQLQQGIFSQRQAEYRASLEEFDGRISAAQSSAGQYQQDIFEYRKRLTLARQTEQMNLDLRARGYVTQQQVIVATDARIEIGRQLANAQSQLATTNHQLESLRAQRNAYMQKWRSENGAALVALQNEVDATREQLRKAEKLNELVTLTAPADAIVLKLGKVSQGTVTSGGEQGREPLFTLVPVTGDLNAEVAISTSDIGFIAVGDEVKLKLDAYSFTRHGTAAGTIKNISEGTFSVNESTGGNVPPYFKVTVAIRDTSGLRNVPENFRLIPGMTLQADVMVGQRTMLSYFVEGAMRTGSEAMREAN